VDSGFEAGLRLSVVEIVDTLSRDARHPSWKKQVPAEVALHIAFGNAEPETLATMVHEGVDGRHIILEVGRADGKLYGIEIT